MKKALIIILSLPAISHSQTGKLFHTELSVDGSLTKIIVRTNVPNHQYSNAGFTLPSGYSFDKDSCPSQVDNTCFFSVSDTNPKTFYVNGENKNFGSTLCLNQKYQLNCERLNVNFTTYALEMGAYAGGANGQIYTGYNNSNWSLYSPADFDQVQFKASYCANDGSFCLAGGFTGTSNSNFVPAVFKMTNHSGAWTSKDTTHTVQVLTYPIQIWDMTCLDGTDFCIAGGNGDSSSNQYGYIWYSYDKGDTWSTPYLATGTGASSSPIIMSSASCYTSTSSGPNCVVAGRAYNNSGMILYGPVANLNSPINFNVSYITSSNSNPLVDVSGVYCSNSGQCILSANLVATYDYSALYYSTDGGATWTQSTIKTIAPPDAVVSNVSGVSCDKSGLNCVASGWYSTSSTNDPANALVYVSHDGGVTWPETIVFPFPNSESNVNRLNGVKCSQSNSVCYVTGHSGNQSAGTEYPLSYVTYNGGYTWSNVSLLPLPPSQQSSPSSNLFTVSLFNQVSY